VAAAAGTLSFTGDRVRHGHASLSDALTPRRDGGRRRRLLGAAGFLVLGLLLVAALGAYWTGRLPISGRTVRGAEAAAPPAMAAEPSPSASPPPNSVLAQAKAIVAPAAVPTRLLVPSIKVDAPVEPVGLDAQGRMNTPSMASNVAWYRLGSSPGDVGDAVMAGHLDWTSGPAVFWSLGKVRKGDEITVVRADGSRVKFVADATRTVPYDSSTDSLFTRDGAPSLTLITCAGAWDRQRGTYLQRLVVHATLVPSVSSDKPGDEGG
jgi:LPXTG-site transpeptidase (sortase) family protein